VKLSSPGQVMVINFWAPWCVPCLGEHQMLNQTVAGFAADKVRFVGIAYQSTDSDVADFLDRVGRNIPTLRDPDGVASIDFGVVGVPETFFVDPTGIVRARVAGPLTQKLLTTVIDRLLQGQSITDLGN
jgi:cytochrome c biogenesis protein CcmG/thiol:disulfide interchange protein DsbE